MGCSVVAVALIGVIRKCYTGDATATFFYEDLLQRRLVCEMLLYLLLWWNWS